MILNYHAKGNNYILDCLRVLPPSNFHLQRSNKKYINSMEFPDKEKKETKCTSC